MDNFAVINGYKVLKALGNKKRMQILYSLQNKEMSVGELEKIVNLSQSALSQHLAVLRKEDIVKTRRSAQTIYYSIKNELVKKILDTLSTFYENIK